MTGPLALKIACLRGAHLALGTAALANAYGGHKPPSASDACDLIRAAVHDGCRLIDTAPTYDSERLVESALRRHRSEDVLVASKISPIGHRRRDAVQLQLQASQRALGRRVDLMQLHNPGPQDMTGLVMDVLQEARACGDIRWIGASVYSEAEALAAINAGVDVLQVPYNLLDQRMSGRVFEKAREASVAILTRSPWLRGALTPSGVAPAKALSAAGKAARLLLAARRLPEVALRFCLHPDVAAVIVGPRTLDEWRAAHAAAKAGALAWPRTALARACASQDLDVIDPRRWDREGLRSYE
jgi:aryl-alcohol dehydrogenase-like predicted oxidoreductase